MPDHVPMVRLRLITFALLLSVNAGSALADATLGDVQVVADLTGIIPSANPGLAVADVNNDSIVDAADLSIFLIQFGNVCE